MTQTEISVSVLRTAMAGSLKSPNDESLVKFMFRFLGESLFFNHLINVVDIVDLGPPAPRKGL